MDRLNLPALALAVVCISLVVVGHTLMKLAIVRSGGMPVLEIGLAGLVRKFMSARTFLLDLRCTASALSFDCKYYLNWTLV
jgi:hypothetical protein